MPASAQTPTPSQAPPGYKVQRTADPVWNGLAIGAGAGLGGGLAVWAASGGCDCYDAGDWMKVLGPYVAIGAAAGVIIDLAKPNGIRIYKSKSGTTTAAVTPVFDRDGAGVRMFVKF